MPVEPRPACTLPAASRTALVILNKQSGKPPDARRLHAALRALERRGWGVDLRETLAPQHATMLAAAAAASHTGTVLVAGGDGTINEAVNGLAGSQTALAVLPAGTVNVWAREVGVSGDPARAVALIDGGARVRIDLGLAGRRYFLLLASAGVDAAAARVVAATASQPWKQAAYMAAGLRDLFRRGGRTISFTIETRGAGGETVETGTWQTLVAVAGNTRLYGGYLHVTPNARLDDGLLDLCVYRGSGAPALAQHACRTLLGRHLTAPQVVYRRAVRVRLDSPSPVPVEVDGEYAGTTPVTFAAVPRALTVVVPRGLRSPLFGDVPLPLPLS